MSEIPRACGECPHKPIARYWYCPKAKWLFVEAESVPPADCPLRRETDEQPNHKRHLAGRFLTLPWRHQAAVAASMGVLTDAEWRLDDQGFGLALFKRAHENECF